MPRKNRIFSSTGIYHITLRSINHHIIFEEENDYHKFLFLLSDCRAKFNTEIYAYCIMDNHIHLLLYSSPDNLASFFQSLGSRFARWYNSKYSRCGHLFQERYHSVAVESERQYLATLLYIHNNPVKAGICRFPSEYRWSSFNAFYGEKNSLVNTSRSFDIVGSKNLLQKYFSQNFDKSEGSTFSNEQVSTRHFLTDENALATFKSITHLSSTSDVEKLTKAERNKYVQLLNKEGLTQKQIARVMDISTSTVKRLCRSK